MAGLKTLKDLEMEFNFIRPKEPFEMEKYEIVVRLCEHKRVRRMVVDWIKHLHSEAHKAGMNLIERKTAPQIQRTSWEDRIVENQCAEKILKRIFDIREEDLKNG